MSTFRRFVASIAVAIAATAVMASSANAYNLSVSPAGGVTGGSQSLSFSDGGGIIRIVCPVTLDGTADAGAIGITGGSQNGQIDSVTVGACSGGRATALVADPWPVTIDTALGTLPNAMTGMSVAIGGWTFTYAVSILGIPVRCTYSGSALASFGVTGSNPYTTNGTLTMSGNSIPKFSGGAACPSSGRVNGSFALSPTQTLTVS